MVENRRHVEASPNFVLHREVVDAVDSGFGGPGDDYVNFDGFEDGIVEVVPSALADPSIAVAFWSDEASTFVLDNPPGTTVPSAGAGVPYRHQFKAMGRKVRILVASGVAVGDTVKLLVSGFNQRKV